MESGNVPDQQNSEAGAVLRQSGEIAPHLMAALIESANDAIISKTLDGTITSWNKGAEQVFGYEAHEIVGQSVLLLIPPDRRDEELTIISRIKAGERIEYYETVRQRKDGTLIDIALTVSPIRDASGSIVGASKIARSMTDLKRVNEQLRISKERYRTLFDSIDEGFCVIQMIFDDHNTPVDWIYVEVNPAFEKHNGLTKAAGKRVSELVPNLEPHWFEIYGKVALTGNPTRFEAGSDAMNRWFDLYGFRVGEPEERKVAVLFTDITERKRSEQERDRLLQQLEAERAKLVYLFSKAPAFVATLRGPDHVVELINPAYLQLVGHRDVMGKAIRQALPEIEGQGFFELLDNVYQTGEAFRGSEVPIQLQREPKGALEQRILDFVYQPIFDAQGQVSGIFAHGIDITEQVNARKDAEEANRAKDEFLAVLSHELRTPLNAILGWSLMLGEGKLAKDDERKGIEAIQRNAQLQAQLIEDILDVSRIITGKLRLEVRPIELSTVVEAAVESVLLAAQAKEIRLQRVLDSGTTLVSGDPNRLQQVVWNLLSNAIKFTPKGGRVQVRLERVNSHIEIIVTDTGMGIPADVLPYVFDRFRQADSTTTRQYGGLGLGLSIVRHVVEMHGGTVEAESVGLGQGTTFTVKLPLIALRSLDVEPEKRQDREHPTANTPNPNRTFEGASELRELKDLNVLVVDDEDDTRMMVATVLERYGSYVTTVNSAAEALRAIQVLRPDVLISDLGMPGEDGYSLIKKIRALPAELGGHTPAAALTAYARVEDRMRVLRAGFQIHVPKPVDPAELVTVVASLAGRHGEMTAP